MKRSTSPEFYTFPYRSAPSDDRLLRAVAVAGLEDLLGSPLPKQVRERLETELDTVARFRYAPLHLAHRELLQTLRSLSVPFVPLWSNGASLLAFALGLTDVDPMPPHYHCACGHYAFCPDAPCETGFDLPLMTCPVCGQLMGGNGHGLDLRSFLGYHFDRVPSLALGIDRGRYTETVSYLEQVFFAKRQAPGSDPVPAEEGFVSVELSLVPTNGIAPGAALSPVDYRDPTVMKSLSRSGPYDPYLCGEESLLPMVKLLACVKIRRFSDLIRICGLISRAGWQESVLPRLQSGEVALQDVVTVREEILRDLTFRSVEEETAWQIMETVRKGRGARLLEDPALRDGLLARGVPEDRLRELAAIRYLPTRAQAIEVAMNVYKSAWHRVFG